MDDEKIKSLWLQLQHTDGPIPWQVLDKFAEVLAEDPAIWKSLAKRYDELALSREHYFGYEPLYIPVIFAKAAPKLNKETILEISPFLVEKLCEAGFDDDDIQLEVFSAACGSMGAVILPTVIDFIYKEEHTYGAWIFLWGLLRLAKQADELIRKQVIDLCVEFLQQAERGEINLSDAESAADVIVHLGCTEYLGLLKRLEKKSKKTLCYGEYRASVGILSGKQVPYDITEMWEEPVEEWLPSRWKLYKEWYEKDKSAETAEDEEFDVQQYEADKLTWRFLRSVDVAELSETCYEDAGFIVRSLFDYAQTYEGVGVRELNEGVLREVLFELFPRKVAGSRKLFKNVAPVTATLLAWLEKQEILSNGRKLAAKVTSWSEEIISKGMDPANWSMGKSFTMKAEADGVDITDKQSMQQYIAQYNLKMLQENRMAKSIEDESFGYEPPIPISEIPARVGRNEPCPCGSGKKYKKCCGGIDINTVG